MINQNHHNSQDNLFYTLMYYFLAIHTQMYILALRTNQPEGTTMTKVAEIKNAFPAHGLSVGQKVEVQYFAYDQYYVFVAGKNIGLINEYYLAGA